MEKIQLEDFLSFAYLSNIKTSDSGVSVFCEHICDEKQNTYHSVLKMVKDGHVQILTNGGKESQYVLHQEGVVFSGLRDAKDIELQAAGEELTSFYHIPFGGGEAVKLFDVPLSVSAFAYLDDDHIVLQAAYDKRAAAQSWDSKEAMLQAKKDEQDYEVFTNIPFYLNGAGFVSGKVKRLYMYEVSSDSLYALTDTHLNVGSFEIDEQQQRVYYVASADIARPSLKEAVYMYDVRAQKTHTLVEEKAYSVHAIKVWGTQLLMLANKEVVHGNNDNPHFFMIDVENKQVSLLNANEESCQNSVGSDCRYGGGQSMQVVHDKCYYVSTVEDKAVLRSINREGIITCELAIEGSIDCFHIVDGVIYFIALKDNHLQEVYTYQNGQVQQLSECNTLLNHKYVASYEEIQYENDGVSLTGWVLLPENYDETKQYPAILDIHGGPKTVYGKVYYHEMQVWANMGYIVFFTNPRGGDGRDNAFADIYGQYGTIDYDDLMMFTDIVLAKYAIDPQRVGVTGGSYGGFMTNWIITHTDRFACAATQRSISNWVSFYGTSDIGYHFTEDQNHGNIYDNVDKLWDHSPLKYARHAKTPTLFIHSDEDFRCPLEQGLQLYTALVDLGVETKFVMFKKENHELSRSGLPKHRLRRLKEITQWMNTYLQ